MTRDEITEQMAIEMEDRRLRLRHDLKSLSLAEQYAIVAYQMGARPSPDPRMVAAFKVYEHFAYEFRQIPIGDEMNRRDWESLLEEMRQAWARIAEAAK